MMLPFTLHERELDQAMADALRGLQAQLTRERALRDEDRAQIQRLEERLAELLREGDAHTGRDAL